MPAYKYERLDKNDAALVILDMQAGLFSLARDYDATVFRNAMYAHAELGKIFGLPVIMSTSTEAGPNGPLPNEFLEMYPNVSVVKRPGEVNAWDNEEFRNAVKATGKSQIIIAGILTDVCTAFCALSLRDAGYSVWANHEASGTMTADIRENGNDRMRAAGVQIVSYYAIVGELMRDWRTPPADKTHQLNEVLVLTETELVGEVETVVLVLLDGRNLAALEDVLVDACSDGGELGNQIHRILEGVSPVLLLVYTLGIGLGEGRGLLESGNGEGELGHGVEVGRAAVNELLDELGNIGSGSPLGRQVADLLLRGDSPVRRSQKRPGIT
ncbi:hypothetical protein O1611_g5810 [Lasiodiplodia mahajangana]|uniref:Uncharacterized protein n=1 Tax=Lasiodiplodia mahajangana TaxID=1108764 RepID=A0ACC2JK88_9PEZI|nr:hypothetical protein O1611_g5810 [Lasiodiplodia mahajangana]